jgi:hypothetical protein
MEKGTQFGEYITLDTHFNPTVNEQIQVVKQFLGEIEDLFKQPEFEGLTLNDFKLEFIFRDEHDALKHQDLGLPIVRTIAWKITKRR